MHKNGGRKWNFAAQAGVLQSNAPIFIYIEYTADCFEGSVPIAAPGK